MFLDLTAVSSGEPIPPLGALLDLKIDGNGKFLPAKADPHLSPRDFEEAPQEPIYWVHT